MRGAGLKPYVQRVLDLLVLRRIGAQQFGRIQRLPGLNALALDTLRDLLQQLQRARMQRGGFLVHKKRHWHAPLALPRQRPVRTVGDHAVQPGLAPVGIKLRGLDGTQCGLAQGLFRFHAVVTGHIFHAGKPLRGRAQDDRRLVAPAMHIAVQIGLA